MLEPRQNRSSGSWKRKTPLEKILIPSCLLLSVLTVLFVVLYISKNSGDDQDVCTSRWCVKSSADLLDYADFKENPCKDFYRYVCGSFYKNAVKKQSTTPLVTLTEELENELKSILVAPIREKNPHALILLKKFYQQCMDEKKIQDDKNEAFLKAVDELGGWPLIMGDAWNDTSFDWVDWQIKAAKLGLPIFQFFTFVRVTTDAGNTVMKVAARPNEANFYVSKDRYIRLMLEVVEGLGFNDTNNTIKTQLNEIHTFKDRTGLLGISELHSETETLKDLQDDCPFVPWLKLLNGLADGQIKFDNSSKVMYGSIEGYCDKLKELLEKTPARTVANYIVWSILHNTYKYLSIGKKYGELDYAPNNRYKICFKDADTRFKYVKETVYVQKKTPKPVIEDLTEMIELMKEVFIEHIEACDWMDPKTKELALRKTEQIGSMIGGGDEMYEKDFFHKVLGISEQNFTSDNIFQMAREKSISEKNHLFKTMYMDEDDDWPEFFNNMLKVNAFFVPPINVMILPAPILNSIFYDYRKPAFMNYGSIGRIIGHEIMHGFEKTARYVVAGNGMIDWWTNKTADAYDKKVQCVIDNYEKIPFRYRLNGTLTLDENVSDFVGIDVAYEAYLKWVEKHGPEEKIPGVHLTPKQIFWVQTGTWLCFRKLEDSDIDYEEEDEHAIPGFRVQAGARNSLHFAKDFDCPVGTFMNPKNKCRIL